ncbi:hypothetical protein AWB92_17170 [Mycobacterium sp. IEC1808]|uniref:GAP family protein n=1 Tax=Mycobacterium sp. IEC1808 TaxID=1743230 RepID=UPI000A15CEAE|nr:GAP family protein [Mycobacterium sp. IEC1808]ORW91900.1 hypothetical protein AWB92_17170 [Mycobacterium sp. IEC1808]
MWTCVLIMGLGLAIDPVRLGLVVVLLSRKRPMVNLLAFWLGGIASGVAIAIGVLVLMHEAALGAIRQAAAVIAAVRSEVIIFSGGRLQITFGLLALLLVAVVTARARAAAREPVTPVTVGGGAATLVDEPRSRNPFVRLGARAQAMLDSDLLWPAFVVGAASSFPPYEGAVLLAVIMASGVGVSTQFSAFIIFTLLVLALIEIPLVAFLAVPEKTEAIMLRVQNGLRTYRLQITQLIFGGTGILLLSQGIAAL